MKTLDFPDIAVDMKIIANARLEMLQKLGVAAANDQGFVIEEFTCSVRGYIVQDGFIMLFDPDAVDPSKCVEAILEGEPPFEVWVLENNRVQDFYEV